MSIGRQDPRQDRGSRVAVTVPAGGTTGLDAPAMPLPHSGIRVAAAQMAAGDLINLAVALDVETPASWVGIALTCELWMQLQCTEDQANTQPVLISPAAAAHLLQVPVPPGGAVFARIVAGAVAGNETVNVCYRAAILPTWTVRHEEPVDGTVAHWIPGGPVAKA